jgi:type IV secretory pathway ATPase VirB11/archaellum biosynthesis ATPase
MGLIGQNFNMTVLVPDDLESFSKVLGVLAESQITIIDVNMDRSSAGVPPRHVRLLFRCHSRSFEQQAEARLRVEAMGFDVNLEHHPIVQRLVF